MPVPVDLTKVPTTGTYPPLPMYPSHRRNLLLNLSTELLVEILSYFPIVDLFSVQRTCRKILHIVAGTTYLQYVIRTQINGVDDFLPPSPDVPYTERLKLLRHHEESWNGLQFNIFAEFTTSVPQPECYILQDGHLIYEDLSGTTFRYGYTDLRSATRDEDMSWAQITLYDIRFPLPSKVVFAVDHDLVVSMRFCVLSQPSFLFLKSDKSRTTGLHLLRFYPIRTCII